MAQNENEKQNVDKTAQKEAFAEDRSFSPFKITPESVPDCILNIPIRKMGCVSTVSTVSGPAVDLRSENTDSALHYEATEGFICTKRREKSYALK